MPAGRQPAVRFRRRPARDRRPVIAGTSLFGGRGYVWSALLGAVVIGSISNGMDLLALDSDIKFMITGAAGSR